MAPNIKLLQAVRDTPDHTLLRVLVNDTDIKYITLESSVCEFRDLPTKYGAQIGFLSAPLPQQDWNRATLALGEHDKPYYMKIEDIDLPRVRMSWHERFINYTELTFSGVEPSRKVYQVAADQTFDGKRAVAKFGWIAEDLENIERETRIYRLLRGHDIGPEFLGHIVEHGRVIGFLLEDVGTDAHAGSGDSRVCREIVTRLLDLDIVHGNTVPKNFLLKDGRAYLISYKKARVI